jgi:photosystem II stability/assembly factor-like uncharacterized protein
MLKKLQVLLTLSLIFLFGCGKAVRQDSRVRVSPERLRRALQGRDTDAVGDPAERVREFKAWQKRWRSGKILPFDQPDDAQAFFVLKRLPQDQTALSGTALMKVAEAVRSMGLYSTARHMLLTDAMANGRYGTELVNGNNLAGTWTPLGPGNIGGRTRAILIHPTTPSTMWAAGVAGGIWKTTNGGATWAPKADLMVNIAVNSMILDPRNPNHLYAGTGEGFFNFDAVRGAGILQSTDGGETWAQLPSTTTSDFYYVQKMIMSQGSSQRLYAATRTGVFRSTDGGNSWGKVLDCTGVNGAMDLAIQTDRPLAMVFAACGTLLANGSTQGAVYRALDTSNTMTWSVVLNPTNMGRTSLAIAPSNQNIVYARAASNESGNYNQGLLAVYRSGSSGAAGSWTTQVTNTSPTTQNTFLLTNPIEAVLTNCALGSSNGFFTQGWYDNIIAVDPANPNTVWSGGIDLFRSDDGGQTWGIASFWWATPGVNPEFAHADHHAIVFHPQYNGTSNQTMYVGNDGGIFTTSNARASVYYSPNPITSSSPICGIVNPATDVHWTALNNGYEVSQFYDGAAFPDNSAFFGGMQDNGTPEGTVVGGRNAWSTLRGGDGGFVAINPANTSMLWLENTGLSIARSTNGGGSFSAFTSGITEPNGNFLFIAPFTQDPNSAANMWTGGARLWRTTQATANPTVGNIWTQASGFLGQRVSAIAVAPGNSNIVYAGGQTGTVWSNTAALSATSATTWASSKPRSDSNYISWVAVDPNNSNIVYATVSTYNSGTGQGHVFKSTDGAQTWTNIDSTGVSGVPDVPVHSIVVDPTNSNILYIGTDAGVLMTLNGGSSWDRENTGFANVITEMLGVRGNFLYAFTHGRSAWRVAMH